MFGPARDPEMSRNIHLDTPANARKSTRWLSKEWNKAKKKKDRDRMKHLKSAAVLAANRASVMSQNPRISSKEQKEAKQIEKIYRDWYKNKRLP